MAEFKISNGIAAIANEAVITHQDVLQDCEEVIATYQRTYFNNPQVFEQKRLAAMVEALDRLIDRQLVLHDFKALGGTLQEGYIDDVIKERIREQFGDRVTLIKSLQAQGITYEVYRQRQRDAIISRMMDRKNVREALLISPAKIERYYQTNLNRFKLGDQIKLRVLRLSRTAGNSADEVCRLAATIKTKIDEGASFAEMASVYSEAWTKQGGLWGWKEESQLKKGLAEIAFALRPGQCSVVVGLSGNTDAGYWVYQYGSTGNLQTGRRFLERTEGDIFQEEKAFKDPAGLDIVPALPQEFYLMYVDEKQAARTRTLSEVRDEIEKDLLLQERARLQKKWIDRLRAKSFVRYFM
jgi:peptidyl-prolyl cis-trans isomerase SurA